MRDRERQLLSVRAIRVSFASAIRHVPDSQAQKCVDRARQLLDHVRAEATDASVVSEIDSVQAELDRFSPSSAHEQG